MGGRCVLLRSSMIGVVWSRCNNNVVMKRYEKKRVRIYGNQKGVKKGDKVDGICYFFSGGSGRAGADEVTGVEACDVEVCDGGGGGGDDDDDDDDDDDGDCNDEDADADYNDDDDDDDDDGDDGGDDDDYGDDGEDEEQD